MCAGSSILWSAHFRTAGAKLSDTPPLLGTQAGRGAVRDRAQLLITNPDMLHMSVLPVHRQFSRIFSNLRYVVVDEGHAYRLATPPYPIPYSPPTPYTIYASYTL